ncbi:hypothetical protein [Aureivirga sp. CE67]|uniref:hypothetical protein n=1 Tax=Aureivirga sp. CE67 TaxID=1788983 RepID=UPI0018CB86AC|nr:hypothetical protein [Aureivirga sp. CE67]
MDVLDKRYIWLRAAAFNEKENERFLYDYNNKTFFIKRFEDENNFRFYLSENKNIVEIPKFSEETKKEIEFFKKEYKSIECIETKMNEMVYYNNKIYIKPLELLINQLKILKIEII